MTNRRHHKIAAALVCLLAAQASAQECPNVPEPRLPAIPMPLNLATLKEALTKYHDEQYRADMDVVYNLAQSYVERRAGEVRKPAVVLDIDETTLTNWPNLAADDFGFFGDGRCDDLPMGPCGFNAWIERSEAKALPSALTFFNAVKAKVAIIFITSRRDAQRKATLWNLDQAKYEGYAKLITRPDRDEFKSAEEFKTKMRAKLAKDDGYTIIASIGDQKSDVDQFAGVDDGRPECPFKLPNPFYFIR